MIALKTPEEMYQYCIDNEWGTGMGCGKGGAIKRFNLLIQNLKDDENVYCVFIGLHNYKKQTKSNEGNYAYALTNKRCIMVQHKLFGVSVQAVDVESITNISFVKTGIYGINGIGMICIDTYKETFNVAVGILEVENIYRLLHETWDNIRVSKSNVNNNRITISNDVKSPVEEIKEYKELLDMGIISKEEFEKKKKELLNL